MTRPYVTRHGNGPLPCEVERSELPGVGEDLTNQPNEWQELYVMQSMRAWKPFLRRYLGIEIPYIMLSVKNR